MAVATGVAAIAAAAGPTTGPVDALDRASIIAPLADRSLLLDIARLPSGRLVAVGERGHVLLSDDAGGHWCQQVVPTRATLTRVVFADARHGVAVGHDAVILVTADGGESWRRVHYTPESHQPLFDAWIGTDGAGLAVGAYASVLATRDFGMTWAMVPFAPVERPRSTAEIDVGLSQPHLYSLRAAGEGRLYLAGEAGRIYRSDDAGNDWQELPSPYEGTFFTLLPLARDSVLAAGLRGHLYRTDDGGQSWAALDTGSGDLLAAAAPLDGGGAVLVGASGVVLIATDARHFRLQREADRVGLSGVVEAAGHLVVVGERGVRTIAAARGER